MDKKSNPKGEKLSFDDTIKRIDDVSKTKKPSIKAIVDAFSKYQNQAGTKPQELIDILLKGIEAVPSSQLELLLSVFIIMRANKSSNQYVMNFMLEKCIDRFNKIGFNISGDTDFMSIVNKLENCSDSFKLFIDGVKKANLSSGTNRENDHDLCVLLYLYLAIKIVNTFDIPSQRNSVLISMERAIVECFLLNPKKSAESLICSCIPKSLLSTKYKATFASVYYLYSDFKDKCNSMISITKKQQAELVTLKNELYQQYEVADKQKTQILSLNEHLIESQKRIEEIQSEKNTAEDRLNYETNRIELQMQSRFSGMAKKYSQTLGLEIDGIEDILEYISNDQARDAIQERINRMRNIISEIGE